MGDEENRQVNRYIYGHLYKLILLLALFIIAITKKRQGQDVNNYSLSPNKFQYYTSKREREREKQIEERNRKHRQTKGRAETEVINSSYKKQSHHCLLARCAV